MTGVLALLLWLVMMVAVFMIRRVSQQQHALFRLQLRHNRRLVEYLWRRLPDDPEVVDLTRVLTIEMRVLLDSQERAWWRRPLNPWIGKRTARAEVVDET